MNIRFNHYAFLAILVVSTVGLSNVYAQTEQSFNGATEQSVDDLVRALERQGRIDNIDLMNNQITVNSAVRKIDKTNTLWLSLDGRPVNNAFVEKGMQIRYGLSINDDGELVISIAQITGPKNKLEELFNH